MLTEYVTMHTVKSIILLILVLFGAYAQHSAESDIKLFNGIMELRSQVTPTDHEHMKRAIALGRRAGCDNDSYPFGSIVVKNNQVIGEGWNRTAASLDPSAHAEMEAIRDACKKSGSTTLNGAVIYASTEPCPMCLSLIYLTGIGKVYYCIPNSSLNNLRDTLSARYIYNALSTPRPDRPVQEIQIMPEEVSLMLNAYKKSNGTVL